MQDLVRVWSRDAFRTELLAWLDEQLPAIGLTRQGPLLPVRVRFWSAVLKIAVSGQGHTQVWVKVANPGQSFEGALLQALSQVVPDHVIPPLALDESRGWWVLPDGGPTLQDSAPLERTLVWGELLRQTARLQHHVATLRTELAMVPGLPLAAVVPAVEQHLEVLGSLNPQDPQHLDGDALREARAGIPRLAGAIDTLSEIALPDTLQPNDISFGNTVAPYLPGGPYRLFDLGDAFWSHPFGVLHLTLRLATGTGLASPLLHTPRMRQLAMTYLDCWPEVPAAARLEVLAAADRIGSVHRALSWARLLAHVDTDSISDPPRVATWLCQALASP